MPLAASQPSAKSADGPSTSGASASSQMLAAVAAAKLQGVGKTYLPVVHDLRVDTSHADDPTLVAESQPPHSPAAPLSAKSPRKDDRTVVRI